MYLYGAGRYGKVVLEILKMNGIPIDGVFDDNPGVADIMGYPVFRFSDKSLDVNAELIVTIGNNLTRTKIAERLSVNFGNVIHPFSYVSARSHIGEGSVIVAGVVINVNTSIGKHCILNTKCSIDHDCLIEDYVHIAANAVLSGGVSVKRGTYIGTGASVIPGISIGKCATIDAGAVIIRDVPDYAVVSGNPGKIVKYNSSMD